MGTVQVARESISGRGSSRAKAQSLEELGETAQA